MPGGGALGLSRITLVPVSIIVKGSYTERAEKQRKESVSGGLMKRVGAR